MKTTRLIPLVMLCATGACTLESQQDVLKSELHPPLTYAQWQSETYTAQSGKAVCAVSSGYGGVTVLTHGENGAAGVVVKSNRKLSPGVRLSINVNGHHYETSQEFFPADESAQLADDFGKDKAYLEWSEPDPDDNGRLRYTSIVKPEGFNTLFQQCRGSAAKPRHKRGK